MKNYSNFFSIVLTASLFGAIANLSAAEPDSDWQGETDYRMMGGYGPGYDMGMMGGYGYGMAPWMMGGFGPGYGMGHGMMSRGNFRTLDLSADQRSLITPIRKEMRKKQWTLMGEMMDAQDKLQELYEADKQDSSAINKQYKLIEDLRRQMVDNSVEAHNRINSILTREQREKFRQWGRGGHMRWGY